MMAEVEKPYPPVSYRDIPLRMMLCVLAAHIMTHYDERDTVLEAIFTASYWRGFIASFIIALLMATYIHYISCLLDVRLHWKHDTLQRVFWQALLGVCIPALLTPLLVGLYFYIYDINILDTVYLQEDYIVALMMIITINVYYFGLNLYWQADGEGANRQAAHRQAITIQKGISTIALQVGEAAFIYIVEGKILVCTFHKEEFLVENTTLDKLEAELDPGMFFRINRKLIAQFNACKSYQPLDYGKLLVATEPVCRVEPVVSQRKAAAFRRWFKGLFN